MQVFFVSDVHLKGPNDPVLPSLIQFFKRKVQAEDTVVFAGDIFDLFVGHKKFFITHYAPFLTMLKDLLNRGAEVYYIEGNHDFFLKKELTRIGLRVQTDWVQFEKAGKKFFVAHGDQIDPQAKGYSLYRSIIRSLFVKGATHFVPGRFLYRLGNYLSDKSRSLRPTLAEDLEKDGFERVRGLFRNYAFEKLKEGNDYVILGHCHDLDEKTFQMGDRLGQYINVGYPKIHRSLLSWTSGDQSISRDVFF